MDIMDKTVNDLEDVGRRHNSKYCSDMLINQEGLVNLVLS